ncbi:MAG TPA: DNA-3-methyladenine glycosylase [Candidatus Babeliaceae bacterium]|nr:DNA-3-methyladenine glycosylase [Candidatus Babeliaceae bacterium]
MEFYRIDKSFFTQATITVAQQLLGMLLIRKIDNTTLIGKIVETESYTYGDPAAHCFSKLTPRNQALFGPVGHAYIYQIYGIHYGFNVVAHNKADKAGGILIRAVEPLEGVAVMERNRGGVPFHQLTNGPGKVTQAFQIDRNLYGYDLIWGDQLFIGRPKTHEPITIISTPRIGITKAQDEKKRFIIKNNPWVTNHSYNAKINLDTE